jgi:hypothetical protein
VEGNFLVARFDEMSDDAAGCAGRSAIAKPFVRGDAVDYRGWVAYAAVRASPLREVKFLFIFLVFFFVLVDFVVG